VDIAQLVKRLVRNKSGKGVDSKGLERTRDTSLRLTSFPVEATPRPVDLDRRSNFRCGRGCAGFPDRFLICREEAARQEEPLRSKSICASPAPRQGKSTSTVDGLGKIHAPHHRLPDELMRNDLDVGKAVAPF
jgi:hypothetical protein